MQDLKEHAGVIEKTRSILRASDVPSDGKHDTLKTTLVPNESASLSIDGARAIHSISLRCQTLLDDFDAYNPQVVPVKLPTALCDLQAGANNTCRFTIQGKNPNAIARYMVGLDYLKIVRLD